MLAAELKNPMQKSGAKAQFIGTRCSFDSAADTSSLAIVHFIRLYSYKVLIEDRAGSQGCVRGRCGDYPPSNEESHHQRRKVVMCGMSETVS